MTTQRYTTIAFAIAAVVSGTSVIAVERPIDRAGEIAPPAPVSLQIKERAKPVARPMAAAPDVELSTAATISNAGFDTRSAFAASSARSPDSSTLSPPVTLTYSGGSPVFLVNDNGTNKGVQSVINNTHNSTSALYGVTNGSGAGLTGYNSGTSGPAGKFGITNSSSNQAAVTTTTNGSGEALLATITTAKSDAPAILGVSRVSDAFGVGVEGQGNNYGVEGYSKYTGVFGNGESNGVWGYSKEGIAVYGQSSDGAGLLGSSTSSYGAYVTTSSGIGLYAESTSNYALYAATDSGYASIYANNNGGGRGIVAHSASGIGVYSSSDSAYGIWGESSNSYGVIGYDSGSGTGIYGFSKSGYAGQFIGPVVATSFTSSSDRNVKTQIKPVDGRDILSRVDQLPVDSWVFKTDLEKRHVGPMAQDFHAAFGLDGDDDKHINLTDIAGVSLAAIKELSAELKQKDAQITELSRQLAAQTDEMTRMRSITETVAARMTALEQQQLVVVAQTARP